MNTSLGISVPMNVPDGFKDHSQYREWQSWRVTLQMLHSLLTDDKTSKTTLVTLIGNLAKRSKAFPSQPFPTDLRVYDNRSKESTMFDPQSVILLAHKRFGVKANEIGEIKTTDDFIEALQSVNPS